MAVDIKDNPGESRFEAYVDGELCGVADYERHEGEIVFVHTEVLVEGKGVGSAIARGALDAVRAEGGTRAVPKCEFISGWMDKHPEYDDLRG